MPKMSKKMAKAVDKAEATHGFSLLTPGKYFAKLTEVRADEDRNKNPMWVAEFSDLRPVGDPESKAPGRQWWNLSLPMDEMPANYAKPDKFEQAQELSRGRLKAFFEAFGYEVESDTDEFVGEVAVITVGISTIQQGPRTGEKTNRVNDIESVDEFGGAPESEDEDAEDAF